jgi:hypothetical protein
VSIVRVLPRSVDSGGGCYYLLKSGKKSADPFANFDARRIFYWEDGEKPVMNVNGKTVGVDPIRPSNYCVPKNTYGPGCQIPRKARTGTKFSETYQAGTVRLRFDNTITSVCDDSSYEKLAACRFVGYQYNSVLTVTDGKTTEKHMAQGSCGHY